PTVTAARASTGCTPAPCRTSLPRPTAAPPFARTAIHRLYIPYDFKTICGTYDLPQLDLAHGVVRGRGRDRRTPATVPVDRAHRLPLDQSRRVGSGHRGAGAGAAGNQAATTERARDPRRRRHALSAGRQPAPGDRPERAGGGHR